MSYLYYPGCCCATKATGRAYEESLLAIFQELGRPLIELEDWNCCGATAYSSIDANQGYALAARNLALAEKQSRGDTLDLVMPCSACYLVFEKTQRYMQEYPAVGRGVKDSLAAIGLDYKGEIRVRHPLDILVNDIGLNEVARRVTQPLEGVRVASYYGCLLVRPYAKFDDPHNPTSMDRLMAALGAEPVDWPLKTRCCGGMLTSTLEDVGLRLGDILLNEARRRGADIIATACGICHCNLECFQKQMGRKRALPGAFFSQLVGYAFGLPGKTLGLQRACVPVNSALSPKKRGDYAHV